MGLRIGTNIASIAVQNQLAKSQRDVEKSLRSLASGSRINQSGDDAAGFAISENLRGQVSGMRQAKNNTENAISFIQVAEGGLNEQNNILIRLRELAVQAASDTVSDQERSFLNDEFDQLVSEFDRIAQTTTFGSKKLLAGNTETFEFQIGANAGPENIVKYKLDADTTASQMEVDGLDVLDRGTARDSLEVLDEAIYKVAGVRANFGAIQSRFMAARDNLDVQIENTESARAKIVDVDVAEATARFTQGMIKTNVGIAALAQANSSSERVLKLI